MMIDQQRTGLEKQFYDLCTTVVGDEGLELYDLDYVSGQQLLRVYIQDPKTGSAVIDDCARVDRALTPYIEEQPWMPEKLILEVSSPGVYRSVKTTQQLLEVVGEVISVSIMGELDETLNSNLTKSNAKSKKIRGKLSAVQDQTIELLSSDDKIIIKKNQIKKAHLDPDFGSIWDKEGSK